MKVKQETNRRRKSKTAPRKKCKKSSVVQIATRHKKQIKLPKRDVAVIPGEAEAKAINNEHDTLTGELSNLAEDLALRAIGIGEKLIAIKKSIGHGHWQQWVIKHLTFSISTAKRYIAAAKPKRSYLSVLKDLAGSTESATSGKATPRTETRLRLFSSSATKVLSQPVESISVENRGAILAEFARFEPIALQLCARPSVFAMSWQKKLKEPPVRWTKSEVLLFKEEIANAQGILAAIEADAQFDLKPAPDEIRDDPQLPIKGDAP